ncbi:uncharacterized protein GGS25DRAFT_155415 [Hypoxylon fragiforme]|uniref:uncharacterized protein n=1 Tax=Hypoxylon fragiforme TaxID=63214 RepID=UPI0020C61F58|nr:uncharacterized protein GGS25DRAFT_155415 [Hypoxylon fragiforme]KAI2610621.1 hypothetical protein GGS25DRAFT_155415 [Hypoxylon fragiforme]
MKEGFVQQLCKMDELTNTLSSEMVVWNLCRYYYCMMMIMTIRKAYWLGFDLKGGYPLYLSLQSALIIISEVVLISNYIVVLLYQHDEELRGLKNIYDASRTVCLPHVSNIRFIQVPNFWIFLRLGWSVMIIDIVTPDDKM